MNQQKPKKIICIDEKKLEEKFNWIAMHWGGDRTIPQLSMNDVLENVKLVGKTVDVEMVRKICKAAMIVANERIKIDKNFDGVGFLAQALIAMLDKEEK